MLYTIRLQNLIRNRTGRENLVSADASKMPAKCQQAVRLSGESRAVEADGAHLPAPSLEGDSSYHTIRNNEALKFEAFFAIVGSSYLLRYMRRRKQQGCPAFQSGEEQLGL